MASSRAFTNRINTLSSSNENLHQEPQRDSNNGFITIGSVTPHSQFIPRTEVDNFLNYSKEKENIG